MHDDMSGILKCYTEETVAKSRKEPGPGKKNKKNKLIKDEKDGKGHNKDNKDTNKKRKHLILETEGSVRGDSDECAAKKSHLEEKKDDGSLTKTQTATGTAVLSSTITKDGDQLFSFSEDELVRELAKRRAARFRLYGAAKSINTNQNEPDGGIEDATGQYCKRDGRDGSIRCTELMEQ